MSFGTTGWKDWLLDEEESRRLIEGAIERGINFFDTANMYSHGDSERILGEVLSDHNREEMVVATKVYFPPSEEPHRHATGLSRKTIEQELQNSLDRLGLETIDLYQIHRWDYDTPIEETLRALDDAVRRGQVRYIGASSMWAHQFAEALSRSDHVGLERFQSMQNHYNLLYREEEREMMPLCRKKGVGSIPWSPLARGPLEDLMFRDRTSGDPGSPSDPLESSVLHFVGHPTHNKHVSDRRAANAVAVKLDHGTRIDLRRFVPHQAEGSPKRLAATGRLHVDGRRVLVFLLAVSPGHVGPLLENVMSGASPGVLPVVYFNDQSRSGGV